MTELQFYNTRTRAKEPFTPLKEGHVKIYTCGPTVYNYAHIGNFRTYVFEDLLRRTLKFNGFQVTQVMNLTDVDDKTIKGAIHNKVSLHEFTKPFIEAFFEDLKSLNIEPVEAYPAATDYIPQMIHLIENLLEKGIAYKGGDGSVYFAIRKFPNYGSLSHLCLEELKDGASDRIHHDEYEKDSASDFVLWKAYDEKRDGAIFWESPFGKGRPGWHLECSAMAMDILGETLDIHVGGVDNIFPHHENEIAQSEGATGKTFVNLWMHSEHLIVDNKKMSKSLGNFYNLRDLLNKGYTGSEVRYMLIHTHYKTQLNFTLEGLDSARSSLNRLSDFIVRIKECAGEDKIDLAEKIDTALNEFKRALNDDLNISQALAALFDFVREMNTLIDKKQIGSGGRDKILNFLKVIDAVLGFLPLEDLDGIPVEMEELLQKRLEARKNKDWTLADSLREQIHAAGYLIEDTSQGARLKKNI